MDLIGLLGLGASIAAPAIGAFVAIGVIKQKVEDGAAEIIEIKADLGELEKRVEKAEDAATQVQTLASAIEHMGERVGDQIKHLVETMHLNNEHTRTQLADIKEEVKHVRSNAAMARQANSSRG